MREVSDSNPVYLVWCSLWRGIGVNIYREGRINIEQGKIYIFIGEVVIYIYLM